MKKLKVLASKGCNKSKKDIRTYLILLCLEDSIFVESFTTSNSYNCLISSSAWLSELWGKELNKDIIFRAECGKGSHSLHRFQLWISVLIPN